MLLATVLVLLGLALLTLGAEALVRGGSGLALAARVSPAVVGLTIVAAGTSMPELVVSVRSALEQRSGLAVGNVVGSNIFNIGAILGLTACLRPLRITGSSVRLEWPVMVLASFQFHLLSRDGVLDRQEGMFLLAAIIAFTAYLVGAARRDPARAADPGPPPAARWLRLAGLLGVGILLLAVGASVLVRGAVDLAGFLGVSETVVGLTVVAGGTSAPELVTSLVAARRGFHDIAVANVIGSNIFNILGILGVTAMLHPLPVPDEILRRDTWWMLGVSLLLFPLMKTGLRINRIEGGILLVVFGSYLAVLIRDALN